MAERGVDDRRLARAGGSGHEQEAAGANQEALEGCQNVGFETEGLEVEGPVRWIEDADDRLLAPDGRKRGNAQHHVAGLREGVGAAFLGELSLVAHEVGHDLQATGDLGQ